MKSARSERTNSGRLVKALVRLTEVMAKFPGDAARISKEKEKVRGVPSQHWPFAPRLVASVLTRRKNASTALGLCVHDE